MIDKVGLVHVVDRRMLVARSFGKSAWYVPGGKRDSGESDVETLCREVREELGAEVDIATVSFYGVFEAPADGKADGTTVRVTCYAARLLHAPNASAEIEQIAWVTVESRDQCSAVTRCILDHLRSSELID